MRSVAAVLLLFLSLVSVGAYSPSVSKDPAVKSCLFRARPPRVPTDDVEPRRNADIQPLPMRRHVATLTAAALLWSNIGVPEAHAVRSRSKQKAAPLTKMMKVKQKLADYQKYAPAAGAVLVATGGGIILGRQTVPYEEDDNEEEDISTDVQISSSVAVDERLEKLNENRQKTLKILDRIAELETEDIIDQYQLRASAQEETQKILERIRFEREQQNAILKSSSLSEQEETQRILNRIRLERQEKSGILPPPPRPTTSYADQLPTNVQKGSGNSESYTDKLSTNEIVNALIDRHAELARKTQVNQPVESLAAIDEAYSSNKETKESKKEESAAEASSSISAKSEPADDKPLATSSLESSSDAAVLVDPSSKVSGKTSSDSSIPPPSDPEAASEKKSESFGTVDSAAGKPIVAVIDDKPPAESFSITEETKKTEPKEPSTEVSSSVSAKSESTVKPSENSTVEPSSKASVKTSSNAKVPPTTDDGGVTEKYDVLPNQVESTTEKPVASVINDKPQVTLSTGAPTKDKEEVATDMSDSNVKADTSKASESSSLNGKPLKKKTVSEKQDPPAKAGTEMKSSVKEPEKAVDEKPFERETIAEEQDPPSKTGPEMKSTDTETKNTDEKKAHKKKTVDEKRDPTTTAVSRMKSFVTQPEDSIEDKLRVSLDDSSKKLKKQDTASKALDTQSTSESSTKIVSEKPQTANGKSSEAAGQPEVPSKSTLKASEQSILGSRPVNQEAEDGESSEVNGKGSIPLEDLYPVKRSQMHLDETTVDSVEEENTNKSFNSLEEKAFKTLADLGMVEVHPDPECSSYDSSKDDEFVE